MSTTATCSPHLWWSELACHDRLMTPVPIDYRVDPTRGGALGDAFEALRAEVCAVMGMDTPLLVLSGYRTLEYQKLLAMNPRLKAATYSQHMELRAVDVALPRGLTFDEFAECARLATTHPDSPIRYVELRRTMSYIHIDVRPVKRLVIEEVT